MPLRTDVGVTVCDDDDIAIRRRALECILPIQLLQQYSIYRVGELCPGDDIVFSEPARFKGRVPSLRRGLIWIAAHIDEIEIAPTDGKLTLVMRVRMHGPAGVRQDMKPLVRRSLGNLLIGGVRRMPWPLESVRDGHLREMRATVSDIKRDPLYLGAALRGPSPLLARQALPAGPAPDAAPSKDLLS